MVQLFGFSHDCRDKPFHGCTLVASKTGDHQSLEQSLRLVDEPCLPELSTGYSRYQPQVDHEKQNVHLDTNLVQWSTHS